MRITFVTIIAAAFLCVSSEVRAVSIAYDDPTGGWTYAYLGAAAAPGSLGAPGFDALDGTWDRENGSDSWDGSALGGTFAAGNAPGGISALTQGGTDFIRLQDTGNPTAAPTSIPDPSNRRAYLGHNIANDVGVTNPDTIVSDGVTLTFRARVATAATGIIDPMFTAATGAENFGVAHGTPWPAEGNGWLGHDGGKGNFGIRESSANGDAARPGRGVISFNLPLASDLRSDNATPFGTTGLTMNSLNGTAPSGTVDPFQNEGTINVLPFADLTAFHEFWITIQPDQSGGGTHRVEVFLDGSETANVFHITSGTGNDYGSPALSYLAMGVGGTPQMGAIDVDFFAYKQGIHLPGGPLVLGDTDGDGIGGEFPDDFEPIRANFRKAVSERNMGDLVDDNVIDFDDFHEWKAAFVGGGSVAGMDIDFFSVPEPASAALAVVAFLSAGTLIRTRRS
ncbi:MAG TPA: hypothetical protein VGK58_02485 [Lacipirellulaceae bacterium]